MEIIYALIAGTIASIGSILFLWLYSWVRTRTFTMIMNVISGMMLSLSILHLLPEGLTLNCNGVSYFLLGFLIMVLFQLFFFDTKLNNSIVSIISLMIHSLLDGVIISITFYRSIHIGILTTAIIILHKLSDGITVTGLLLHKQHYKNNLIVLILSILISSFTPLGTVISSLYLKNSISITLLGAMFCMTAGMFIFITSTEFIPEMFQIANKKDKLVSYLLFLFGILTTIIVE